MRNRVVLGLASLCLGCHTYSAIAVRDLAVGNDVKLEITPDGGEHLRSSVGPRATVIDGAVVRKDGDGWLIAVADVVRDNGVNELFHGDQIHVPADAIATAQIKRLDTVKSLFVAGAIGVGSALVAHGSADGIAGPRGGGGSTTPK